MESSTFPLLLFLLLSHPDPSAATRRHPHRATSAADACHVARHRSLCLHSLAPLSGPSGRRSPRWWARAAVSVTLNETERVGRYLRSGLEGRAGARIDGRAGVALSDCDECLGNAAQELRSSLAELLRPAGGGGSLRWRMGDVVTWVSAALTNQGTCLDGLAGCKGPLVGPVRSRVLNATYYASNALALVNSLAHSEGN